MSSRTHRLSPLCTFRGFKGTAHSKDPSREAGLTHRVSCPLKPNRIPPWPRPLCPHDASPGQTRTQASSDTGHPAASVLLMPPEVLPSQGCARASRGEKGEHGCVSCCPGANDHVLSRYHSTAVLWIHIYSQLPLGWGYKRQLRNECDGPFGDLRTY